MKFSVQFRKLLINSVINGIPQIVLTKNFFRKLIKIVVFVFCVSGFLYQTLSFLEVYWSYPTVVDVQSDYPDELPLPAVSICSHNGIKSVPFCKRFPNHCHPNSSLEEFCAKNSHLCDENILPGNLSYPTVTPRHLPLLPRSEYSEMGIQPEELVRFCSIYTFPNRRLCTNDYKFFSVFNTLGLPSNCYAYNSLWETDEESLIIKSKTQVFIRLTSERNPTNQFYTGSPFAIQMAIHNPYTLLNPFKNGFSVKPCTNYYVFVSKHVFKLLPPPYSTNCFDYGQNWINRGRRGPLSNRLCYEECLLNVSMEAEGCVDPYFISYPNMEKICSEEPANEDISKACTDLCKQACYQEDITVDVQEHAYFDRGDTTIKNNMCFSTVSIAFNRMEVLTYSFSPKYESIELFGYIGGYLGMWLGISLVAFCDVIEAAMLLMKWSKQRIQRWRRLRNANQRILPINYSKKRIHFLLH